MRKLLSTLVLIGILILAVGFWRGWFVVSSSDSGNERDKTNIHLTVDKAKMQRDADAVKDTASTQPGAATSDQRAATSDQR